MERFLVSIGVGLAIFASFPASTNYHLNSYSVGPMGTSNSHSTTYYTQSTGGEVSGNKTSSTNYTGTSGVVQTEQLSTPLAPTLGNGSGTYYNQLTLILNDTAGSSNYPADTQFAIAISTNNFATINYVQTGGTLGASPSNRTYAAWGGGSGMTIVGLTANTTYEVKVAARQGLYTQSAYGPYATIATVPPSITFSLSTNSLALGSLLPGSIVTSGTVTFGLATNAVYGANIYTAGQYAGLYSAIHGNTIGAPATGDLSTSTHGFGLQDQTVSQTSGGPVTKVSPYNGTGNAVGTDNTTYTPIFSTSGPTVGGTGTMNAQAKSTATDPASNDYQEILTFVAAASY